MGKVSTLIGSAGMGALMMYVMDPDRGKRRRAIARDKMIRATKKTSETVEAGLRDARNRALGSVAELRATVRQEEVPDAKLVARIRSRIGRVISHPSAIEVECQDGQVMLRGPILAGEVDRLLRAARSVRGVKGVGHDLKVKERRDDMPALQGGVRRTGPQGEMAQENWTPALRVAAGLTGGSLLAYGMRRHNPLGYLAATAGAGLMTRAATNLRTRRLLGIGVGRRAVDIQKSIRIAAPVEEVFDFWSHFENFPLFMQNVEDVVDKGNGRSHWVVRAPLGATVEWEAETTELIPNERIAWKTVDGPLVGNAGTVNFIPEGDAMTRVDVRLSYNPPAGAIGHGIATILGSDPKQEMDGDLARMKNLLEGIGAPNEEKIAEKEGVLSGGDQGISNGASTSKRSRGGEQPRSSEGTEDEGGGRASE